MAHLPDEILELILIRLSVTDLIRCKSVCKSWQDLISRPRFIKAHLNHSYLTDHNDDEIGDRRLVMSIHPRSSIFQPYRDNYFYHHDLHLLGSSDGLVCISPLLPYKIVVVNPSTREVKKLKKPKIPESKFCCFGFGYDSSSDDYKVVLGFRNGENSTCFQVYGLRSDFWKIIGEVDYAIISKVGVLCKGVFHWIANDNTSPEKKNVVLSFNLSDEKFMEVPQPGDLSYQSRVAQHSSMRLGILEGCLCVFRPELLPYDLWVLKDYNKKQSCEMSGCEHEIKYDVVHCIKSLVNYIPNKNSLCHETSLIRARVFLAAPLYVESLVSPHFHKKLKRKRRAISNISSPKVKSNTGFGASTSARV